MKTLVRSTRYPVDARAERILSSALNEFARRGFAGAREGVIARRAGVAHGTLRSYFPSKEELFREVVRSTIVSTLESVEPTLQADLGSGGSVRRLHEFAQWFWRTMDQPVQGALLRLAVAELPRFPELALFHSTEVMERAAVRLERMLADGASRGELRIPDPRATARVILSALITHAHWFSHPEIYAGLTGPDRTRAEVAVVEVLVESLRARAA